MLTSGWRTLPRPRDLVPVHYRRFGEVYVSYLTVLSLESLRRARSYVKCDLIPTEIADSGMIALSEPRQ